MPFFAQKLTKTAENRLVLGLFSLFLLFLQSCSPPPVLDELTTFENNRWHIDSAITVQWAPQDAEKPVFMGMYVRHLDDYPYNNLYLFRTIRSSQGVEYSDTVNIALADDLGRWNGTGMSTLKTVFAPIGGGAVRFKGDERYTLSIIHGMRDTVLTGIQDVIVKFEQAEN